MKKSDFAWFQAIGVFPGRIIQCGFGLIPEVSTMRAVLLTTCLLVLCTLAHSESLEERLRNSSELSQVCEIK